MKTTFAMMIFLLVCHPVFSDPERLDPNKPGDLAVAVAIGDSPDYIQRWTRTPPSHTPHIPRINETEIGEMIYIAFLITGQQPDEEGSVRVDVDVTIRMPDGEVWEEIRNYAKVRGKLPNPTFVMADPAMDFGFDEGDQLGNWVFEATAYDHNARTRAHHFTAILVKARDQESDE